jgi:hypothetical protein
LRVDHRQVTRFNQAEKLVEIALSTGQLIHGQFLGANYFERLASLRRQI